MLLVPGVDTAQGSNVILFKVDILSDERLVGLDCLRELHSIISGFSTVTSFREPDLRELSSIKGTTLFGFSARFFKGHLTEVRDQNAKATRFGITQTVPPGLRRMNAREDHRFKELCTNTLIADKESDLLIVFEFSEPNSGERVVNDIQRFAHQKKIRVKTIYQGAHQDNGRSPLGFKEGISNLQDVREQDYDAYRRYVYVHNSEAGCPHFDGGTYLVFRKYLFNVDRWFGDAFSIRDNEAAEHCGSAAREITIGRSRCNGLVIERETGNFLDSRYDEEQTVSAFEESHIRQANPRGIGRTSFGIPVCVKDARILRRGFSTIANKSSDGSIEPGLLFLCFQSDIQKRGFEFIHNEWLMSHFFGGKDRLLDPDSQIVEPVDGCYYFCPPFSTFPGDIFFEQPA